MHHLASKFEYLKGGGGLWTSGLSVKFNDPTATLLFRNIVAYFVLIVYK